MNNYLDSKTKYKYDSNIYFSDNISLTFCIYLQSSSGEDYYDKSS